MYNNTYKTKQRQTMKKIKSTFTLSDFIVEELNQTANELNEKKSHIVEKALSLYFDYLDEKIADKRLDKLQKGETKTISVNEVFQGL